MLTKKDVANWTTGQKGSYAEAAAKKMLEAQGWEVEKIKSNQKCNDFILKKDNKKHVAEIKGAVDFGYKDNFFCEVASKKELDTEWEPSFWLGQDIDLFCYYSFSENKLFMYNGKLFKAAAFDKLEEPNALFDISAKTARGFKYNKRSKDAGFLGVISYNTSEDI
jgi:hypothetical protein